MSEDKWGVTQASKARYAQIALNIAMSRSLWARIQNLPPPPPPTRWERIQAAWWDWKGRFVTAWRVLRGDDIHEDCDY